MISILFLSLYYLSFCISSTYSQPSSLRFVQILFRHGDRAPIKLYPTDPNHESDWPRGLGGLTEVGMQQQFALGIYLSDKYQSFLSQPYNQTELYVRSTDVDRTIESVLAQLAGIFPPTGARVWNPYIHWAPIAIHTIPAEIDNVLRDRPLCPRFDELFKQSLLSHSIQYLEHSYKELFKFLTIKSGENVTLSTNIRDTVFCELQHNLKQPDWINSTVVERLNALAAWQYIEVQWSDEMKRLRAGPLLHHLLESIDNFTHANPEPHAPPSAATTTTSATASTTSTMSAPRLEQEARKPLASSADKKKDLKEWRGRKLHLYSAHDGTLLYALTALSLWRSGAAFGRLPPYASAFVVELHYRHARYELDFFFRNRTAPVNASAVQLFLPGCPPPCRLADFRTAINHLLPVDWEAECKASNSSNTSKPSPAFASALIAWPQWVLPVVAAVGAACAVLLLDHLVLVPLLARRTRLLRRWWCGQCGPCGPALHSPRDACSCSDLSLALSASTETELAQRALAGRDGHSGGGGRAASKEPDAFVCVLHE